MQILALDTASPHPSVAVLARGEVFEEPVPQDRRASEELLPAIERCLARADLRLPDCDRIAVCSGPGSFTGLRIGLATAWALGRAAGVPVETVSTLEALAETARDSGAARIATALDAGRGEVVIGLYSLAGPRAVPESPPERMALEAARVRADRLPLVSMPADLVSAAGRGPAVSASRALALAVARAPGKITPRLAGIYSRPSAAEEKHGAA